MTFADFIKSAVSNVREVVAVDVRSQGAHLTINMSVRNSRLEDRLHGLSAMVRGRWPGYSLSWSPLNDRPFNEDHFEPVANFVVPTVVGLPYSKRQKRSFV